MAEASTVMQRSLWGEMSDTLTVLYRTSAEGTGLYWFKSNMHAAPTGWMKALFLSAWFCLSPSELLPPAWPVLWFCWFDPGGDGSISGACFRMCFIRYVSYREKEMHIRFILKNNWECCSFMVRDWVLMFVPRYMCGCINHRSRVCRAWLCEWTDELPGWLRLHNHGYSGDTYTACPCCADADETVKDWEKYTKVTIHPQKNHYLLTPCCSKPVQIRAACLQTIKVEGKQGLSSSKQHHKTIIKLPIRLGCLF